MTKTTLTLAALSGALALGCEPSMYDFRVFDELARQAWVHASGPPDGAGGRDYGTALAGGGQSSAGAGVFVTGHGPEGFAFLAYRPDGTMAPTWLPLADVNTRDRPNALPNEPIVVGDRDSALVAVGMSNSSASPHATVAVLDAGTGRLLARLNDMPSRPFELPGEQLVSGLAFGATDLPDGGERSVIVARGELLSVIADVANDFSPVYSCRPGGSAGGVVAGELVVASPGDEIAVTVRGTSAEIQILPGSAVRDAHQAAAEGPCFDAVPPLLTLAAPLGDTAFGRRMLIANLDGNGAPDLVVSGRAAVYVYLDVSTATGVPEPIVLAAPGGAAGFGAALAVGDMDGDDADELVVGAPDSAVQGADSAGAVYVYSFVNGVSSERTRLSDAQPEAGQRFGRSVAIVPMAEAGRGMLVVGAKQEAFAYFRTPFSSDLRTGR